MPGQENSVGRPRRAHGSGRLLVVGVDGRDLGPLFLTCAAEQIHGAAGGVLEWLRHHVRARFGIEEVQVRDRGVHRDARALCERAPIGGLVLVVLALFAFMSQWNEFIWPLLAITSEEMRTVQIGLRYLLRDEEAAIPDWPLVMAGTMITLVPLLIAYVFAERHLIRGITMGSFR